MNRSPGTFITFYSYKGGVGRSMCVANVAALLAGYGRRVLIIDWDLEAPGIERFFLNRPSRLDGDHAKTPGLVELVQASMAGEPLPWRGCLLHAYPFGTHAELSILTAGRDDDGYAARVRTLNWDDLFAKGFGEKLEALRDEWLAEYDFVLLDSRTGITDIGNICTIHLPDILMLLFTTSQQSLAGVADVARRARVMVRQLPYDRKKVLVVPVPARDETQSQQMEAIEWRGRFAKELRDFYLDWVPTGRTPEDILEKLRIPYKPFWSFGERLPVAERGVDDHLDVGYAYQILAKLIHYGFDWEKVFPREPQELRQQERLGTLIRDAEAMLDGMGETPALLARSVLVRLVYVAGKDEGAADSRRWLPLEELTDGERRVLPFLEKARLIERDSEQPRIQLADPGLISDWPLLNKWVDEDRELLLMRQQLRARDYRVDARDAQRALVLQKRSGIPSSPREQAALDQSLRSHRMLAVTWIVALVLTVAGLAWVGWRVWSEQQRIALELRATRYAAAARELRKDNDMAAYAALLAREALKIRPGEPNLSGYDVTAAKWLAARVPRPPAGVTWVGGSAGDRPGFGGFQLERIHPGVIGIASGKNGPPRTYVVHGGNVDEVALSTDFRLARTRGDGREVVWRGPAYGMRRWLLPKPGTSSLAFSPDARFLASASESVTVWDAENGREVQRLSAKSGFRTVAFDPSGTRLAAGGRDGSLFVITVPAGSRTTAIPARAVVHCLAWSSDGKVFAAGSEDGRIRIVTAEGKDVAVFSQESPVTAVAFAPANDKLVTGGTDGFIRRWQVRGSTAQLVKISNGDVGAIKGLVHADGIVAAAGSGGLKLSPLSFPGSFMNLAAARNGGMWLAAASETGASVTLHCRGLNLTDCEEVPNYARHIAARSVAFAPGGRYLATAGEDGIVLIWDVYAMVPDPCQLIGKNLTPEEWKRYLGDEPYKKLCPSLP